MASTTPIKVSVSKLGVVLHSHEGCTSAHDPNRAHDRTTDLHDRIGRVALLAAAGLKDLSKDLQVQYVSALRTRDALGKTAWVYAPKKVAEPVNRE